jgi:hypothetical protein
MYLSMWPVLRYLELLLSSFAVFVVVVLAWVSTLSGLFSWAGHHPKWTYGVTDAVTPFFSIGAPFHPSGGGLPTGISEIHAAVACLAMVGGALHFEF